jgi:transcriptional regulator with GAF, ATPase, and Fis domain
MGDAPTYLMATFAPAGIVSALVALLYIALTLWVMWAHRQHIDAIVMVGVILLLLGQVATVFNVTLREIGVTSLMSVAASALLGYRLARMQLFNPLLMQMTQFSALRELSQALIAPHDVQQVLNATAQQSRRMLNTDLALIILRSDEGGEPSLIVGAQDGWTTNLVGRRMPLGSGLSGRVYESKTPMRLQNYHAWEGQASAFADVPMKAAVSIPLLYDDNVVGVLTAGELKPGRVFGDRDQAMLEMLAPQAAVAIVNARLRQQIAALRPNQPSSQPV